MSVVNDRNSIEN